MAKRRRPIRKPPPVIDCARVLCYARINKFVGYAGRALLFVDGKELGRVPCMAICESQKIGILLFHCCRNWKTLGCSGHESVAAAKKKAESIYPGLSSRWIAAGVTKKRARQFLDGLWGDLRCGFCGKRPGEVRQLFSRRDAKIYDACLDRFYAMLHKAE